MGFFAFYLFNYKLDPGVGDRATKSFRLERYLLVSVINGIMRANRFDCRELRLSADLKMETLLKIEIKEDPGS